jgi:hypothetical protein
MAIWTSSQRPSSSFVKPPHGPHAKERVEEHADAQGAGRFRGRPVGGVVIGTQLEEFVPEAELDAEERQHAPGHEGSGGKDDLVIGRVDRGEEHGEQADDAQQDAVEKTTVALLLLVGDGVPEIEARHTLR